MVRISYCITTLLVNLRPGCSGNPGTPTFVDLFSGNEGSFTSNTLTASRPDLARSGDSGIPALTNLCHGMYEEYGCFTDLACSGLPAIADSFNGMPIKYRLSLHHFADLFAFRAYRHAHSQ